MNPLKKILMLMLILSTVASIMATTVTIGTGTSSQYYPIDRLYNYSAAEIVYLQSEIGMSGSINRLAFQKVSGTDINPILDVSIYMKQTTATTLATGDYSTADYTLVYTGPFTNTATTGWMEVTLTTPYTYSNTQSLSILVVKGFQQWTSSCPYWGYTATTDSKFRYDYDDDAAPTTLTQSLNRPNIQLNIVPLEGPAVFAMSHSAINFGTCFINVTTSATTVTVSNNGGTPMHITSAILGGANASVFTKTDTNTYPVTLAAGGSMSFTVSFLPLLAQQYNATVTVTDDLARTPHILTLTGLGFDNNITTFPYVNSFDETAFPPIGWTNQRIVGTYTPGIWAGSATGVNPPCTPHSGTTMAYYNSYSISANVHTVLSTPPLTLPGNNYRVSFWMYRDISTAYNTPKYSDEGISAWFGTSPTDTTLAVNLGFIPRDAVFAPVVAANGWYKYGFNFPANSAGAAKYVILKVKSQFGNNIFLDDVTIELQPTGVPLPAMVSSPANNVIDQFPTISLNWLPDGTGPATLGYRLSFGTDNPPTNVLNNSDVALVATYTPTLQFGTTYYWKVVPYNALGNATDCPIWTFTTMADPTVTTFPYLQNFDSVTIPAIPVGWSKMIVSSSTAAITTSTSTPNSAPNNVLISNSGDANANVVLVSPPTPNVGLTRIRFWAKGAANYVLLVGTVTNPADPTSFSEFQTINLTATYAEYSVSFAGYAGQAHYIGFKHGLGTAYQSIYLDDFSWLLIPTGPQVEVNVTNLAYGDIYNNSTPVRVVQINNSGLADLSFTVATSGQTVTTNLTGTQTLTPGSSVSCNVTLHPIAEGALTGSITINSNDPLTPALLIPLSATVLPALAPGLIEVGNGSLVEISLPVEPYYNHSFSQTIYLQTELNQPNSSINSIFYKFNGASAWSDTMLVYLGQTTRSSFTSTTDYVPATELTLVYSGLLTVTAEAGWVEIPLDTPYTYDNVSNLVVCIDKDTPYHPNANDFYCAAVTTNRSLEQHADAATSNSNVNNPLAGTLKMNIPDTRFQFHTLSTIPLFSAIPSVVTFGQVNVDNTSTPINVQVRNAGGGTLIITQPITLTGVDVGQFAMTDTHTYPVSLNAGQSITVSVTFTPNSAGVKSAQLNITDNLVSARKATLKSYKSAESERLLHVIPISGSGNDGVIHTFPYSQGYEEEAFPAGTGWVVADGANPGQGWRRRATAGNSHNGTGYAVVGTLAGNHWMMTPKFEIGAQSNTLRYWIKDSTDTPDSAATSVGEYLKVLVSTTNADSSSFVTQLHNYTNYDLPSTYQEMTLDLTPFNGQNIYLCFLRHSTGGKFIYVDDFSVAAASGVLNPPTNLTYQVINENNVTLTWVAPVPATGTTLTGYKVYRNDAALHTITDPLIVTDTDISVASGTYTYKVSALYLQGESGFTDPVSVSITGGNPNELINDGFDFYPDFALNFGYWTNRDVDQQNTYNFANTTYPNLNSHKAFMVFNPSAAVPPLTNPIAHSGNKMLAAFDTQAGSNNDWLITPRLLLGEDSSINFWAKSYNDLFGLEQFTVAISTTDNNAASFTNVITGLNPVSVPATSWTYYDYDLSNYDGQHVYIAFRCVSTSCLALLLDDYKVITTNGVGNDDPAPLPTNTVLLSNYPNPFNPETIIRYAMKDKGNVLIEVYNTRGQKVTTLENSVRNAGNYSVKWSGKDQYGHSVGSGVYFYRMKTGSYTSTKKMILLR